MSETTEELRERYSQKIAQLLAMAERTAFEGERELLTAKAEELMAKWGVEAAVLNETAATREGVVNVEVLRYSGAYAEVHRRFAGRVALAMGLKVYYSTEVTTAVTTGRFWRTMRAVAFPSDIERFKQLYASLDLQMMSALQLWWEDAPQQVREDGRLARVGFINGFSNRLAERLFEVTQRVRSETPGAALVLRNRDVEVLQEFNKLNLTKHREANNNHAIGARAGRSAANLADLGQTRVGHPRVALT